jgi:hypothetical protein
MTVSFWQDRSAAAEHHADITVIGAGITGASVAWWLAREGLGVQVVDRADPGAGASGRNAGMVLLGTADPYAKAVDLMGRERARRIWEFTRENRTLLLERVLPGAEHRVALERSGSVHAAASEHEWTEIVRSAALLAEDGFPVSLIEKDALARELSTPAYHGGLFDPEAIALHPVGLCELILEQAVAAGARFHPHHEVHAIEPHEGDVEVRTHRATFVSDVVLLCTNAYAPLLHGHFVDKVYPTRGQMWATAPVPRRLIPWAVYADFGYEYFRQLPTGQVLAGGWRQHHENAEKGYSDETTADLQDGLWDYMTATFPDLASARITHRWAGVMGFSADGLPLLGELPSQPRVKYLLGYTGHGYGFAFRAAKALADLVVNGTSPGWLGAGRLKQRG